MFIFTAKFNKRKALIIVLALAIILGMVIFIAGRRDQNNAPAAPEVRIERAEDVVAYLESLGWQVSPDPIEVQDVLIPREFSAVYEVYNTMQKEAGFDLSNWRGRDAVRFTYQILNYPDHPTGIVADVLVADHLIIGGNIQSIQLDGFMHELRAIND